MERPIKNRAKDTYESGAEKVSTEPLAKDENYSTSEGYSQRTREIAHEQALQDEKKCYDNVHATTAKVELVTTEEPKPIAEMSNNRSLRETIRENMRKRRR